jgi:hypothetical protein|tara:strand:+ start:402 stop:815 length:414 start_codon:yes stop_codon:yes gene_type:complete
MALVGGGGSPNVAGGNPSGTGTGLNYIGNHAYLTSGNVACNNVDTTIAKFTTGQNYIDAKIQFHYNTQSSDDMRYTVKINGEVVVSYINNTATGGGSTPDNVLYLLLPSYSDIEFIGKNESSSGAQDQNATLTGRVY